MVKSMSLSKILNRKIRRNLLSNLTQYIAVILITGIAMTLLLGLQASAEAFENRVNQLYKEGNMADIWTTTSVYDSTDKDEIEKILGEESVTEERLSVGARLNGGAANALIYKEMPTISKPVESELLQQKDFFIVDDSIYQSGVASLPEKWVDPSGGLPSVDVDISMTAVNYVFDDIDKQLQDLNNSNESSNVDFLLNFIMENPQWVFDNFPEITNISELIEVLDPTTLPNEDEINELMNQGHVKFFDSIVAEETADYKPSNVFNQPYLSLDFKITGTMLFPENVQRSATASPNFLLSNSLFMNGIDTLFDQNFNVSSSNDDLINVSDLLNVYIYDLYISGIKEYAFNTNQYTSKVPSSDSLTHKKLRTDIDNYFANKETNNLLLCVDIENFPSNLVVQSDITQSKQFTIIFPSIFFLVAILVVLTTTSQIILKERSQIGTMKALGISKGAIIRHYLTLTLLVVAIGCVLGMILGPFILPSLLNIKYSLLYVIPANSYVFPFTYAIISLAILGTLVSLVTYLIVRKEAAARPVVSMRAKERKSLKVADHHKKPSKKLSFKMAIRNIRLSIARSAMVVVGVIGCTALLVCGFGINDTIYYGIDLEFSTVLNSDAVATYSIPSGESRKSELEAIEGIAYVEEYATLPTTISGDKFMSTFVYCLPENYTIFNTEGKYNITDDVLITTKVARESDLGIGDTISFTVLGKNYTGKIGYVMESFYSQGIFLNTGYGEYTNLSGLKTRAWVNFDKDANVDEVISSVIGETNSEGEITKNGIEGVTVFETKEESVKEIQHIMSSVSTMTSAVLIFAILLAIVVLYNLALLNFNERYRDIATLKVLGFSHFQIGLSLFYEIMILTTLGIGIGLLFGLPMEILVLSVNQTALLEFIYYVSINSYIYSFLITILTAIGVNLFLGRLTKEVKMVESLKSVE